MYLEYSQEVKSVLQFLGMANIREESLYSMTVGIETEIAEPVEFLPGRLSWVSRMLHQSQIA